MSVLWTNELELKFLELYQAEPVLWDSNDKNHKNKIKCYDAWMRISTIMDISTVNIKKKRDSLLSSYRSYKYKVKKSQNSGAGEDEVYKPIWFAYDLMDSFLGETGKCNKTINTEHGITEAQGINRETTEDTLEENKENLNPSTNAQKDNNPTIRRRKNPSELAEAGNIIKDALATFKSTLKRNETQIQPTQEEDECDLYAKLLARKMRKISELNRLKFMHDVDDIYIRHQFNVSQSVLTPTTTYFFNEPRPGTSSSTNSEPPIHYGQMMQKTHQHRKVVSAPASNIIIQSNQLVRTHDTEYPILHNPNPVTDDSETSNQENDIIQSAFHLS